MARSWLLQPWTRLDGPAAGEIVQTEERLRDLGGMTDVAFYLSIKDVTVASLRLSYETSPSKDSELFAAMATVALSVPGRTVSSIVFAAASEPLSRWVRWRLFDSGAAAWSVTFRVWAASVATARATKPGLAAALRRARTDDDRPAPIVAWPRPAGAWPFAPSARDPVVAGPTFPLEQPPAERSGSDQVRPTHRRRPPT